MYAHISDKKITNFASFAGLLAVLLLCTFVAKNHIPFKYSQLTDGRTGIVMAAQSLKTNILDGMFGDGSGQLALGLSARPLPVETVKVGDAVAEDVPVLVYHGITSVPDRFSTTREIFKNQMVALKKAGYHTVTLQDFLGFMNGEKELRDKAFLLTFDDGRADSYEGADALLRDLDFTAVMFVATADSLKAPTSSKSYYLNENQLRSMVQSGRWELGSHAVQESTTGGLIPIDRSGTLGNFLSNKKWLAEENRLETNTEYTARVTNELVQSKNALEEKFGIHVVALSYPFSDFGQQTVNNPNAEKIIAEVVKANYSLAFQQIWPTEYGNISNYPDMDHLHLLRTETGTTWTGEHLVTLLQTGHSKTLPYTDMFETDNGWRSTWGLKSLSGNALHIEAATTTAGSFVFLDGARDWKDYMYSVEAYMERGSHISLLSRFSDDKNNTACVFSKDSVRIEQEVSGRTQVLVHVRDIALPPYPKVTFGMSVSGSTVKCYEGSRIVAYASGLSSSIHHGGIALQIWNSSSGNASLYVTDLKAVPASDAGMLIDAMPNYTLKKSR